MTENDLIKLLEPIKNYIMNNEVYIDDIEVIVLNHFPSNETITEISKFIQTEIKDYTHLTEAKLLNRTRQLLTGALRERAKYIYYDKLSTERNASLQSSEEDIEEEYLYDDEYEYRDEKYKDYD